MLRIAERGGSQINTSELDIIDVLNSRNAPKDWFAVVD